MADKSFWSDKKDKEWFKNFFYYHKVHIVVIISVILIAFFFIKDYMAQVTPDISVDNISAFYMSDKVTEKFKQHFQPIIKDIDNKDGNILKVVNHTVVGYNSPEADMQMIAAMEQSISLEMAVGESYIYFLDDSFFEIFKEKELLCDLSEFSDLPKGTYSIQIQENKLFKELTEFDLKTPVHLCVRTLTPSLSKKQMNRATGQQENAVLIFKEFYKNEEAN